MTKARRRPGHATAGKAPRPVALWRHGVAAMGDERWEEAIAAFKQFLDNPEPNTNAASVAYQNLSVCYTELERFAEALEMLEIVKREAANDPDTYYGLGVTSACGGRFAEAIAAFDHLAQQWPKQAQQHEVTETLAKLRRLERSELPAGDYLVDHLKEQISHNLDSGDWNLVERKARRMIAANPERPEGYFALGEACLQRNCLTDALEALRSAQARDEADYGPSLYNLGYTCLQLGQLAEAQGWLERSRAAQPDHLATLLLLGEACEKLGRREAAVAWWRQALAQDSSFDLAQRRLHEVGAGPAPIDPLPSPQTIQMQAMLPLAKARMRRPHIHTWGGITLTYDPQVGFVLEDSDNSLNFSLNLGGPFRVARMSQPDLSDLMGSVKLLLRMMNTENTREVAILAYYAHHPTFNFQLRLAKDQPAESSTHGRFVTTDAPQFFKLRVDSELATTYAAPMQGTFVYLRQPRGAGVVINTLGLEHR